MVRKGDSRVGAKRLGSTLSYPTAHDAGVESLFRYCQFNPTHLRSILEGKLHCSDPSGFNDPWDCRPHFTLPPQREPLARQSAVAWLNDQMQHSAEDDSAEESLSRYSKEIELRIGQRYRVCCFSTKSRCALMWSHYANKHQGICLEFDVRDPVFLCAALKVEYYAEYPVLYAHENTDLLPLTSKSIVWKYEAEYRFIGPIAGSDEAKEFSSDHRGEGTECIVDDHGFACLPKEALVSVIVGCQMPVADVVCVKALIERYDGRVQLKRAVRVLDHYDLKIEPF